MGSEMCIRDRWRPLQLCREVARQTRHLSYISEFTSDIRHISGSANVVADILSRPPDSNVLDALDDALADQPLVDDLHAPGAAPKISSVGSPPFLDTSSLLAAQSLHAAEMNSYFSGPRDSSLKPAWVDASGGRLLCDVSHQPPRPVVSLAATASLLEGVHGLAHAGGNATLRDVRRTRRGL